MQGTQLHDYTAFHGQQCIASGDLATVVAGAKEVVDRVEHASILIFDNTTSRQVEIDFRGTPDEVLQRLAPPQSDPEVENSEAEEPKAGRPKLGVVAREVTLLPRHWEWLASQPGSASVTLRKLVEEARRNSVAKDKERLAHEATHRFMMIMAGNLPGFEEASRALDRKDKGRFEQCITHWPTDIREHVTRLAEGAGWES
jgi:hypothetical protein